MKKILYTALALLLCGAALFLSSCTALSELEQLGVKGWLELGAPLGIKTEEPPKPVLTPTPETPYPTTVITPSPTAPDFDLPTSLPIIITPPTITQIIDGLEHKYFDNIPVMLSYTGAPSAFSGVNSSAVISAVDYIEYRTSSGNTLFNHRDRDELESLLSGEEYFADVIYVPISDAIKYARLGYLSPINHDVLSIETEEVYYTDVCEQNSPDEYTYFTLPSFSTPYEHSIVVYCNTDLLARITGDNSILTAVEEGAWTVDLLFKYISLAKENLSDGYLSADTKLSKELLTGTLLSCSLTDVTREIAEYIASAFNYSEEDTAIESFFQGRTVFYIGETEDLRKFNKSADSYAILPLPCENQFEEKYPVMYDPDQVYVLAVPKTAVNADQAMIMMDMVAMGTRYQFRFDFIESMYAAYIRQNTSILYTSVSRFDGTVYTQPIKDNSQEENTEDQNDGI